MPVDGARISTRELREKAQSTGLMDIDKLETLLEEEPRVVHEQRRWRLLQVAPVRAGSPLDRLTKAVLQADSALSRRQLIALTGIEEDAWKTLREPLLQQPAVEYVGVGRGAKYLSKALFDQMAEAGVRRVARLGSLKRLSRPTRWRSQREPERLIVLNTVRREATPNP